MHKIVTTILAVAVIILGLAFSTDTENENELLRANIEYVKTNNAYFESLQIRIDLLQTLVQRHEELARANINIDKQQFNMIDEQIKITEIMKDYDFGTTKLLCDRIAKLEAAAINQSPK